MKFSSASPLPSSFSQLAAALRQARLKAQSEEGDEDDKDIKRKSAADIADDDDTDEAKKRRKAKAAKDKSDGGEDEGDDDGDEKRKDATEAASAEFVRRMMVAGEKRRGLVQPPEPTDAVARAIVRAGAKRRGEV